MPASGKEGCGPCDSEVQSIGLGPDLPLESRWCCLAGLVLKEDKARVITFQVSSRLLPLSGYLPSVKAAISMK